MCLKHAQLLFVRSGKRQEDNFDGKMLSFPILWACSKAWVYCSVIFPLLVSLDLATLICKQDIYNWRGWAIIYWLTHTEQIDRTNELLGLSLFNVPVNIFVICLCWQVSLRWGGIGLYCSLEWASVQCQLMLSSAVSVSWAVFFFSYYCLLFHSCSFPLESLSCYYLNYLISVFALLFVSCMTLSYVLSYVFFFKT